MPRRPINARQLRRAKERGGRVGMASETFSWADDVAMRPTAAVTRMLQADGISLMCLQHNYDGSPMHPLYVPMSKGLEPFSVTT